MIGTRGPVRLAVPLALLGSALLAGPEDLSRALLAAAERGEAPRVTALLARGADPNSRDREGRPALLLAAASGQATAVSALLRGGADADAGTRSGWTALHTAAEAGSAPVARALLDAGAEPDPRDRIRATPLDVAEQSQRAALARLLRAQGARGSGKSIGDTVCVRLWDGDGFCGVVAARDATRSRLRVTQVVGCDGSCPADASCSAGRPVGPGGLVADDTLWVPVSCLTHTGVS